MSSATVSTFALHQRLNEKLAERSLEEVLQLIQETVERVFNEPLCTAEIFGSFMLDSFCQQTGALTLQTARAPAPSGSKTRVYLVTKLQRSGGHTRVLEDIIRAAPKEIAHLVLSTELLGPSDRDAVTSGLQNENVSFEWNTDRTRTQKLRWVQDRLREIRPEHVWLFNHHPDSVIISAVQPAQGYETHFYHHGDHHFSLGLFLAFATHIDPLPMGYHRCRSELGIEHNVYLPLWMKDGGDRASTDAFMAGGGVTTCTAAKSNKVEVPYFISYVSMVPDIIEATGGRHIHIGRLTPWALWRIRRTLQRRKIDPSRFIYSPWEPSIWRSLQEMRVDLFIASYPYAGARTIIEAMGSGTPTTVHDHYSNRMVSCIDMVYPGAFLWRNPVDFLTYLGGLSAGYLTGQGRLARSFFLKYHDQSRFQGTDPIVLQDIEAPALKPHTKDMLQIGLDIVRQITPIGLVWRFIYRHRRIIKKLVP